MQARSGVPTPPGDSRAAASRAARSCLSVVALVLWCAGDARAQELRTVPPFGQQPVGYTVFTLPAGPDTLSPHPADTRRLLVEAWFPAREHGSTAKPWASGAMGAALANQFPFPDGFHSAIASHAWLDGRPVAARVPAIVFSHGLSFPPTLYQSFFEDLASRGYAVFAVSHPHGAAMIEYPDGTTLEMALWPRIQEEAERQRMLAGAAGRWAADLSVVIEAIRAGDLPGDLAVDGSRIGLLGHSLGGTAVGKLSRDERVSGVVVMEGEVREPADEDARGSIQVAVPLLHLIGGYNRLELERRAYLPGPGAPVFTAIVQGTGHAYFSDLIHFYRAYANREWRVRHRYETDPDRVIRIASDYIAAFFDWRLMDAPRSTLLRRPSYAERVEGPQQGGYPEVDLTVAVQ